MGKRVLVVFGAGASHDLLPEPLVGYRLQEELRPPLTKNIFDDNERTRGLLLKYPGAKSLAASLRVDVHRNKNLEPLLRTLSSDKSRPRAHQFLQIPLYLQDLLSSVSSFTDQPVNYIRLLDQLFAARADVEKIALVTLNYDTLLEHVLAPDYLGAALEDMDSYIGDKCMLVKLHGSVNWVRRVHLPDRLKSLANDVTGDRQYFRVLQGLNYRKLSNMLAPEPEVRPPGSLFAREAGQDVDLFYPALAVPLGKYHRVCPAAHEEALIDFLPGCKNVLVVGASGQGTDLLNLLRDTLRRVATFTLVGHGEDADEAVRRFRKVPQLPLPDEVYDRGFSHFILAGGPEEFIRSCK